MVWDKCESFRKIFCLNDPSLSILYLPKLTNYTNQTSTVEPSIDISWIIKSKLYYLHTHHIIFFVYFEKSMKNNYQIFRNYIGIDAKSLRDIVDTISKMRQVNSTRFQWFLFLVISSSCIEQKYYSKWQQSPWDKSVYWTVNIVCSLLINQIWMKVVHYYNLNAEVSPLYKNHIHINKWHSILAEAINCISRYSYNDHKVEKVRFVFSLR